MDRKPNSFDSFSHDPLPKQQNGYEAVEQSNPGYIEYKWQRHCDSIWNYKKFG